MKRGRPKAEDPKGEGIRIRFTQEEYLTLKAMAKVSGESMSDLIRRGLDMVLEQMKREEEAK